MCSIAEFDKLTAPVNKIIRFSSVDGPGNRTAIFLQGCGFECEYCHNPETIRLCTNCGHCVALCPAGALRTENGRVLWDEAKCCLCDTCIHVCPNLSSPRVRQMTVAQVMDAVENNRPFVRGITVSGGECTRHRDFVLALARIAGARGLDVLLDSNGSYDFSSDGALMESISGVMLDIKAWDEGEHRLLTGCSNETVLQNLRFLAETGKLEEVRTVVVPGRMNPHETVERVSRVLREINPGIRYKLIKYRPMGVRAPFKAELAPPDEKLLIELEALAHSLGICNTVRL